MNSEYTTSLDQKPVLTRQGISFYHQMATHFRQIIASGVWKPSEKLPSMDELAVEYGVARVTIRQAIKLLEADGMLETMQGRGTFVRHKHESNPRLLLQTDWQSLLHTMKGQEITILHSELRSQCLSLEPNLVQFCPSYRYQYRLHSRAGKPIAVNHMFLDERIYSKEPALLDTLSVLLEIKRLSDYPLSTARQVLTITEAQSETARLLDIPLLTPMVNVRREVLDTQNTLIYSCEIVFKGDAVKLDISMDCDE